MNVLLHASANTRNENPPLSGQSVDPAVEAMDGPMNSSVGAAMEVVLSISPTEITTEGRLAGGASIEGFP